MAQATKPDTTAPADGAYLLTEPEAAHFLGMSHHSLRMSRYTGRLCSTTAPPWLRLGRQVRYRTADLIEWAEGTAIEHRHDTTATANA